MSVTITYFVHGTTTDNESDLATGWLPGELSVAGKQQSIKLGTLLANNHYDAVYTSDLKRAIDSTHLCFGNKYEIVPDKRLRECNYGDFTGLSSASFKTRLADFIATPFPNGESYKDVEKRIASFIQHLRTTRDGEHVAIVAHQAPQLALDVLLKDRSWKQAIDEDWRITKSWQPGWEYIIDS